MAIGPILQKARQQKQLTSSQVAEITRMKVQIVDDLENDDFHRVAATIYGKGFIKLFAECVDIDPEPLIVDYMQQMGSPPAPQLPVQQEEELQAETTESSQNSFSESATEAATTADDLFSYADHAQRQVKHRRPTSHKAAPEATSTKQPSVWAHINPIWQKIQHQYQMLRQTLTQGSETISKKFSEAGSHDKWIQLGLVALGILVVFLILIPLVRMLLTPRGPTPLPDNELILFVSPPEPYFE